MASPVLREFLQQLNRPKVFAIKLLGITVIITWNNKKR